jgi:citrate lyase subunit beta / citryl-CoA lyase
VRVGSTLIPAAESRTWLFVPGDRPDRFDKASTSSADQIIIDLEDSVAGDNKVSARLDARKWLTQRGRAWVRINALDTEWYLEDIASLLHLDGLLGFIVPKAEDPGELSRLRSRLPSRGLIALIESSRGIRDAHEIASCASVDRLAFGSIDFAVDIDASEEDSSMLLARSTLVLASRAARKPAPIDGVTTSFNDLGPVIAASAHARALGFGAKLCIHPAQLAAVSTAFSPSDAQVLWARATVAASEDPRLGAMAVDGFMIDRPVVRRARRILEQMERVAGQPSSPTAQRYS